MRHRHLAKAAGQQQLLATYSHRASRRLYQYHSTRAERGHTTPLGRGVYACPLLLDRNPIRLCVPSQNGLLFEPPQRHKDMTAVVVIGSPLSPLSTTGPFTM